MPEQPPQLNPITALRAAMNTQDPALNQFNPITSIHTAIQTATQEPQVNTIEAFMKAYFAKSKSPSFVEALRAASQVASLHPINEEAFLQNFIGSGSSAAQSQKAIEFFFSNLGVDDAPELKWSDYEKNLRADIQGKNKTGIMQKMNDARRDGSSDKINGFRRACMGINGQSELIQKVIDKCLTPDNSQTNDFFPGYLPINDDHLAMFVKQVIDPTSVWLVYPFDMQQTRSKTEAEYWNDLNKILQEVDENMIRSSGQSGVKYFDEYLAKRCLPLASKPGLELMNDVACRTWVKLNTLKSTQRDNVIDVFCNVNNDEHAGSRECSCYWSDSGNDAPWKDQYGHKSYNMEKDPDPKLDHVKRMHSPVCYLKSCENSGLKTQVIEKNKDACPKCVSMNTVMGSNNKVNQSTTCALNTENVENIAGPNAPAISPQPTTRPNQKNVPTNSSPPPQPTKSTLPSATETPAKLGIVDPESGLNQKNLMYGSLACCACCGCAVALIVLLVIMNRKS